MTNQEAIERIQSIKSKVSLYNDVLALRMAEEALENQKISHCKDCDRWNIWYSDEGYCDNWRTLTGEDFYCKDFEVKENKE